jgi:hypothetical protein
MSSVPIEEERFKAYLDRPECPGSIVHSPRGDTSSFIATTTPCSPMPIRYVIQLPYHWTDERRIHEVAQYIVSLELRHWQLSALDHITTSRHTRQSDYATLLEIADRLIAPRPWVEDMVRQLGTHRNALQRAAQTISVPWTSMRTVLNTPLSRAADAIHRQLRGAFSYPWFLPEALRDHYSKDCW